MGNPIQLGHLEGAASRFNDIGLLSLGGHFWNEPWFSDHYLISHLSKYFPIVWSDPPTSWRKIGRNNHKPFDLDIFAEPYPPGVTVYQPEPWLPGIGRPRVLASWTGRERLRRAKNILLRQGCREFVLLINRPQYAFALDEMRWALSCYRICDEYTFSKIDRPIEESEKRLISRVDQVFISSPGLFEKKGRLNPETVLLPNGVDYLSFSAPCGEPEELKNIPHPRIGYIGIIKSQLDFPLWLILADQHKEWSFVLVGPKGNMGSSQSLFQKLLERPNVFWLDGKPRKSLPAYIQHMDVCMLIYKVNGYTKFIYPLKLHTYLASGRPIVGSRIRSLLDFSSVVALPQSPEEWSQAITKQLSPQGRLLSEIERRRTVARKHDWKHIADTMAHTIYEKIQKRALT